MNSGEINIFGLQITPIPYQLFIPILIGIFIIWRRNIRIIKSPSSEFVRFVRFRGLVPPISDEELAGDFAVVLGWALILFGLAMIGLLWMTRI